MTELVCCGRSDRPALAALWQMVFGDQPDVTDAFFEVFRAQNISYAAKRDGEILSAFHLLPCSIRQGDDVYCGSYLYAAATKKEARGQGLMRALLAYAADRQRGAGADFICLYPAEPSLYTYYAKSGFQPVFSAALVPSDPYPQENPSATTAEELADIRRRCYGTGAVEWGREALLFLLATADGSPVFPDRRDDCYKLPVWQARRMGLSFRKTADGMLLPLSKRMNNSGFIDLYLGMTLD